MRDVPLISFGGRTTPCGALISSSTAIASLFIADGAMMDYLEDAESCWMSVLRRGAGCRGRACCPRKLYEAWRQPCSNVTIDTTLLIECCDICCFYYG